MYSALGLFILLNKIGIGLGLNKNKNKNRNKRKQRCITDMVAITTPDKEYGSFAE
jgi:hypothetical protein